MSSSDLLTKMLDRPALYVGESVKEIQAFVSGYEFAIRSEADLPEDPVYRDFQKWLVERFGFGHSYSWSSIISFVGMSEANAFNHAVELWREYLLSQATEEEKSQE